MKIVSNGGRPDLQGPARARAGDQQLGATILAPVERWTGTAFPQTGRYLVAIDRERDQGLYEETNLRTRDR